MLQNIIIDLAYGTVLGRGNMRRWLSYLVARLGTPIDVNRAGCNFRLYLDNNLIEFGILLRKRYNAAEIDFLKEGLTNNHVAVDIGCNIGLYTLQLANCGATVVAVDPNPMMTRQLAINAAANGFDNVQIFECAVGERSAKAELHIRNDDMAIVSVVESDEGSVEIHSLEKILQLAGATRVDVLKIDVEGYEDKALAPFIVSCSQDMLPTRIVIEEQDASDHPACQQAFQKRGYRFVSRTRNNSLYELASI